MPSSPLRSPPKISSEYPSFWSTRHDCCNELPADRQWQIVEADLWDRDFLDMLDPAMLVIKDDGYGEIAFGAMQATLDLEIGRSTLFFTWEGFDEMDEVRGSGSAELLDDGSLDVEFAYHLGNEAQLKARRVAFSATC